MVLSTEDTEIITQIVTQTVDKVFRANKERDGGGEWTRKEILDAKKMSMVEKFNGGEAEYKDWARSLKGAIRMRSGKLVKLMEKIEGEDGMETRKAVEEVEFDEVDVSSYRGWQQVVEELYCWLELLTTGEARAVVRAEDEGDGIQAWKRIHKQYNRRTISRLMRIQNACMYPKVVQVNELVGAVMLWEDAWKRMTAEHPTGTKIPDSWKMGALMQLCPKEVVDVMETRWDEIGENYETLKQKVIAWAANKVEKTAGGGVVPMDIGVATDNDEWGEYSADYPPNKGMFGAEEYMEGAVHEYTRCYECGGYGHMAADCASKGKGKGGGKAGWNQKGKGKGKAEGKGVVKGGWTPPWGGKGETPGWTQKGGKGQKGKGKGYQGTCWKCWRVGHKAAECRVQQVEVAQGGGPGEEVHSVETVWPIGSVEVNEVVEVTIDSGAAKSVWPISKNGVTRRKARENIKLMAANGSPIKVEGEAILNFTRGETRCEMKFLDADVRKPLGAVSAIVDQGNTVVFSKGRSYIKSDTTGERIPVVRSGGTYVIQVEGETEKAEKGTKYLEVNAEEEIEEEAQKEGGGSSSTEWRTVFRRRGI